jgi:hypothetical protein
MSTSAMPANTIMAWGGRHLIRALSSTKFTVEPIHKRKPHAFHDSRGWWLRLNDGSCIPMHLDSGTWYLNHAR